MWIKTQVEVIVILLSMGIVHTHITISSSLKTQANKLIQNVCDIFDNENHLQQEEDQHWMTICKELFRSKRDIAEEIKDNGSDLSMISPMRKAAARVGIRTAGYRGVRGTVRNPSASGGIRTPPSNIRFVSTRTGQRYSRPTGWMWSRSRLLFLPLATRYILRSHSSSNKYTTPSKSSVTYYYCTSNVDDTVEIQCPSINGDNQCCEDEDNDDVFCCGGEIPDDFTEDMNRAARTLARVFYTLAILALVMHVVMRLSYR